MSLSSTGDLTLTGNLTFNHSSLPTFTNSQLGYYVLNGSSTTYNFSLYTQSCNICTLPVVGVYIVNILIILSTSSGTTNITYSHFQIYSGPIQYNKIIDLSSLSITYNTNLELNQQYSLTCIIPASSASFSVDCNNYQTYSGGTPLIKFQYSYVRIA